MWNYLAYSMRPDGYGALNNDSDRVENRSVVSQAAALYQRPDWTYITTNARAGRQPQGEPSRIFPWAGQIIMRSGWDTDAHWAFFDIGPSGINYHIHRDKLHLSLAAYGRDLLVDSGRYSYVRDCKFWRYFRDSASHNVILIDGRGQKTDIRQSYQPLTGNYAIAPEFDFARSTFNRGFIRIKGKATHSRAVVYLRGCYWVVVDWIDTDRPRQAEALWHFHPDCSVAIEGDSVVSTDPGAGNLRIIPAHLPQGVEIVTGQEDPVQGWWSREYNHIAPNPTAIYSMSIEASTLFAWVLVPARGSVPHLDIKLLPAPAGSALLAVEAASQQIDKIAVRLAGDVAIELGGGLKLQGDCAIWRSGQQPLVACGWIADAGGRVVAEHRVG
jgi:hypothetical protein